MFKTGEPKSELKAKLKAWEANIQIVKDTANNKSSTNINKSLISLLFLFKTSS